MFNNIRQDLRAHGGDWGAQGFWALVVYRFGRWRWTIRPTLLRKALSMLYRILFKLVEIVTGITLPCAVKVGPNFVIDHHGGIIIHGDTEFGRNCRIRSGVMIGVKRAGGTSKVVLGDDVDIGAGAKILGNIRIGSRVRIGANAVVRENVPDDAIVFGDPAIVKVRRRDARQEAPRQLRRSRTS